MKLKKLEIELIPSYRDNAGQYEAAVHYEDKNGEIKLLLDPAVSSALLACIGETITKFAAKAAQTIETSIMQSVEDAKGAATKTIEA